jgi:hypothetical protein
MDLGKLKTKEGFAALLAVIGFVVWAFTGRDVDPEVLKRAQDAHEAVTSLEGAPTPGTASVPVTGE